MWLALQKLLPKWQMYGIHCFTLLSGLDDYSLPQYKGKTQHVLDIFTLYNFVLSLEMVPELTPNAAATLYPGTPASSCPIARALS